MRQLVENYIPTAIATLIEPFWLVLNRLLCMLQPFEELRRGRAPPQQSIGLDYSSLPPQFVIWKAFRSGHTVLAAVCGMTLLANVLAVAFSGLFFENTVEVPLISTFSRPYDLQFQPLNGSAGPFDARSGALDEVTSDPFYIATSNLTAKTPMPPWTDDRYAYLPFVPKGDAEKNSTWQYRATTPAFGVQLNCSAMPTQGSMSYTLSITSGGRDRILNVSLPRDDGHIAICHDGYWSPWGGSPTGQSALELIAPLFALNDTPATDISFCREHILAAWLRVDLSPDPIPADNHGVANLTILSRDETVILCRQTLVAGTADIVVDAQGRVQRTISVETSSDNVGTIFGTSPSDLIGQAQYFTLRSGQTWHNDSFPSDFNNYLIEKHINSTRLIDPSLPPPSPEDAASAFADVYSKLFAILIGTNMDMLLTPAAADTNVDGFTIRPTVRVFLSKPMFIIAETILALYIVVTTVLYVRRPWRILPRLPTTPASTIAFFAASRALQDVRGTARYSSAERERHLERLDNRYGFGSFIGTDGKPHAGIEKMPFFTTLSRGGSRGLPDSAAEDGPMRRITQWWSRFRWKRAKAPGDGWSSGT